MENNMKNHEKNNIDSDVLEEIREILMNAMEERKWIQVEEALEIINEELGYDSENFEENTVTLEE
jgi:hypothetical protein